MIKFVSATVVAFMAAAGSPAVQAAEKMHPFVLASDSAGDMAAVVADTQAKLTGAGFEIAGSYAPFDGAMVIAASNDALRAAAAKSEFGGYGAVQRVSITARNGKLQVAYTNPAYMAGAYRMADNLADATARLTQALGAGTPYGAEKDAMTDKELRKYHYMFGMEYFDEPSVLNSFKSHAAAVDQVEKGLAAGVGGAGKVYRVDIPGKDEVLFGVSLDGAKGDGDMQDDKFIMAKIDFNDPRSTAHLPYEILVSGKKAYALYARFRIAMNFPTLSMMGNNSFFSIMGAPDGIQAALMKVAGSTAKKPSGRKYN